MPRPNFLSPHPQPHALFNLQAWVRMHILCLCTIPASSVSLILQFTRTVSNTHILCSILAYCVHIRCKTNEKSPYAHILSQKKNIKNQSMFPLNPPTHRSSLKKIIEMNSRIPCSRTAINIKEFKRV